MSVNKLNSTYQKRKPHAEIFLFDGMRINLINKTADLLIKRSFLSIPDASSLTLRKIH